MSSQSRNPRRPSRRVVVAISAVLALVGLGFLATGGGVVGADFTSSTKVSVAAGAGTLTLGSSGKVQFVNLVPGTPQTSSVVLTNSGSLPGKVVTIGAPVTVKNWALPNAANLGSVDFSQVVVTVANSNLPAETPLTALPSTITMNSGIGAATDANHPGTLVVAVTVKIKDLDPAVNNPLQGASVAGEVTGTASTGH
ncbi:MAG TPA: hypothetical protein VIQ80_02035 [Candidatus Saccharimonadales bacterium]